QNLNEHQTLLARRRHLDALLNANKSVSLAKAIFLQTQSGELMAEDLRSAQKSLNEITGEFNTEDLLGKIFSSFCIGK
ncbi:MAG: tRNA uridine-5-carboxymethylaminomethyl(34) synthesis GTPase MnmE, partial [Gammaproteobacteria bacterium]|nr:tRNA uridine-5-carboxymethylaminomethyl(34) synthesis GTPase MnmE [Gammaproteobacteria bacterium]